MHMHLSIFYKNYKYTKHWQGNRIDGRCVENNNKKKKNNELLRKRTGCAVGNHAPDFQNHRSLLALCWVLMRLV